MSRSAASFVFEVELGGAGVREVWTAPLRDAASGSGIVIVNHLGVVLREEEARKKRMARTRLKKRTKRTTKLRTRAPSYCRRRRRLHLPLARRASLGALDGDVRGGGRP